MALHDSVLELIGRTPMVKAQRLDTGVCQLYLKLENANPGGSIKDRIGLSMIEAAQARGDIRPGATLVEGTAGNTGIGLALVAQQKGYKLILVVPDKMSREKIFNLKAMGAEVVLTRSDVAKGHPEYYQDLARTIAERTPGFSGAELYSLMNEGAILAARENRKEIKGFTPQAMDALLKYSWPGNVRELENAVERAAILCLGEYISERELPMAVSSAPKNSDAPTLAELQGATGEEPISMTLDEMERAAILRTLQDTGDNKSEAARRLGITRATLHNKLRRYDME